jgi:hypothetical protein
MAAMGEGFFAISDTTDTCGWMSDDVEKPDPLIHAYIEKVDFRDVKGGVAAISVTAARGQQKMTREDVDICTKQSRSFLPPTKSYQVDFTFEGGAYHRYPVPNEPK